MKKVFGSLIFVTFLFVGCAGSGSKPATTEETTVESAMENLNAVVEEATDSIQVAAEDVAEAVEEATE